MIHFCLHSSICVRNYVAWLYSDNLFNDRINCRNFGVASIQIICSDGFYSQDVWSAIGIGSGNDISAQNDILSRL